MPTAKANMARTRDSTVPPETLVHLKATSHFVPELFHKTSSRLKYSYSENLAFADSLFPEPKLSRDLRIVRKLSLLTRLDFNDSMMFNYHRT